MYNNTPKQFISLLGKPIFIYALEIIEKVKEIDRILVIYHPFFKGVYKKYINDYNISNVELVEGGITRQQSVLNGLKKVTSDRVIIHEAARPFISTDYISELLKYNENAIVPSIPIPFSVAISSTHFGCKYMHEELDRSLLNNIQLPQIFNSDMLLKSHIKAEKEGWVANEDSELVFRFGKTVRFVNGMENNIKITTPLDLIMAEILLKGTYK